MTLPRPRRLSPVRRGRLAALPLAICVALAPVLIVAPAAIAQSGQSGEQSPLAPRPAAPALNINFAGGSIGDYIEAVKKAAEPTPVNTIISDDVARLKANPVELRGVSVHTALQLLGQGQVLTPEPISVAQAAWDGDSAPVYLISSGPVGGQSPFRRGEPPPPQRSVQVFSIRDLVEPDPGSPGALTIDPETLMSSIDAAMSLHGESEGRDVLFHPEAGILIVRAEVEEIAVVKDLINEIRGDILSRRSSAEQAAQQLERLERRRQELETQAEIAKAELQHFERRLEQVETLRDRGGATGSEAEELQLQVVRARAKEQALQQEYGQVMNQLREQRAGVPGGDDRQSLLNEITRLKAEIAALRAELGRGEDRPDRDGR